MLQYIIWLIFLIGLIIPPTIKHFIHQVMWSEIAACSSILLWSALVSFLALIWLNTDINTSFVRCVLITGLMYGGSLRYIEERLSVQAQRDVKREKDATNSH
jgi:hypothetical protein